MPEKFPLPEIKGRPKKSERDITKGGITEKGAWKSEELINLEGNASSANPQGLREFIPEKVSIDQTPGKADETVDKINGGMESIGQRSSNVLGIESSDGRRSQMKYHTKQNKERRENILAKRARKKLMSNEAERYEALFNG